MLLAALRQRIERGEKVTTFFSSTSEVYGKNPKEVWTEEDDLVFGSTTRPRWSYGVSKAIDEFLALACVKEYNLPIVIGRFFNVVGPRQTGAYGMVLPRFVQAALSGKPLRVHDDGQQIRCFSHVHDVIQAITQLGTRRPMESHQHWKRCTCFYFGTSSESHRHLQSIRRLNSKPIQKPTMNL